MGTYEARIIKENKNYIFDFPSVAQEGDCVKEAQNYAQKWIEEHRLKIEEDSQFFIRVEEELYQIN